MNIHTDDGRLDYDRTRVELLAVPAISNEKIQRQSVQLITAAILLDVAESLRTLRGPAFETLADMEPEEDADDGFDLAEWHAAAIKSAPAGARVEYVKGVRTGDRIFGTLTGERGITEGAGWVGVLLDGEAGKEAGVQRAWVDELAIVPEAEGLFADRTPTIAELAASPVPLVGVATEAETPALLTDEDDDGEPAVGGYDTDEPANPVSEPDDLDDDFDGDRHVEAADAVAALKARRKAAKGKKS